MSTLIEHAYRGWVIEERGIEGMEFKRFVPMRGLVAHESHASLEAAKAFVDRHEGRGGL